MLFNHPKHSRFNLPPCQLWILWLAAWVFGAGIPASAHLYHASLDGHQVNLTVEDGLLKGEYLVSFGQKRAVIELEKVDADADGKLSRIEVTNYLLSLRDASLVGIQVIIKGESLAFHLPVAPSMNPNLIRIPFEAPVPKDLAPPYQFEVYSTNPLRLETDLTVHLALPEGLEIQPLLEAAKPKVSDPFVRSYETAQPLTDHLSLNIVQGSDPDKAVYQVDILSVGELPRMAKGRTWYTQNIEWVDKAIKGGGAKGTTAFLIILLALVLGGFHALTPGHGKTIVAAYLVGSRGRVLDAVFLGSVVTFTHTFSVILLGLVTLYVSQFVVPERILPYVALLSGLLITGLGLVLFVQRLRGRQFLEHHHHDDDGHHHHHHEEVSGIGDQEPVGGQNPKRERRSKDHHHAHDHHLHHHEEVPGTRDHTGLGSLLSLGISGGMVPCPEALGLLLTAIYFNQLVLGLMVLVAFSVGLAAVLIAIGVVMVLAKSTFERFGGGGRFIQRLPIVSAALITILGGYIVWSTVIELMRMRM